MQNPYTILNPPLLQGLLKQPMYFVRQYYPRGKNPGEQQVVPLLLTHYGHHDVDKERADRHMRLLYHDRYRFVYDSTNPEHLARLQKAAEATPGFRVYINLLTKNWKPTEGLKRMIARFIREKMPGWDYHASDKLQVTLKERYGELFIALLWKGRQMEVHLDDIENIGLCATT